MYVITSKASGSEANTGTGASCRPTTNVKVIPTIEQDQYRACATASRKSGGDVSKDITDVPLRERRI